MESAVAYAMDTKSFYRGILDELFSWPAIRPGLYVGPSRYVPLKSQENNFS